LPVDWSTKFTCLPSTVAVNFATGGASASIFTTSLALFEPAAFDTVSETVYCCAWAYV
jgi:hypothetical protein